MTVSGDGGGDGGVRVVARPHVAVIGASQAGPVESALAFTVGDLLVRAGAVIVCGGGGGVMEAACRGAQLAAEGLSRGGHPEPESGRAPLDRAAEIVTIGILPGLDRAAANPYVDVAIPTGMGELRNGLIVRAVDAVVAVGGAYGTLSEIALALRAGKRVVGLQTWELSPEQLPDDGFVVAAEAEEAVAIALDAARSAKL
ncbi:hypothetical protein Q5424_08090 [Conexibacter sp. JD483]|uniref:SLOG cluster 4 domain-containing protein n=1 Tax=unclassified Conexibacter TaxID=2627773 RepID=UPI00271D28CD|nr:MULTISPECIES: hypothetical protein [unclassified Conexibacter]MDO8184775.1 hypothetical protein [Conexibacter sp. CPCC 205706]MDO8196550.1 hypothetical protein [Conexibacter sp. CPCC 205762]MDR9369036.1 hypothetical protein [Conexibacter sp. JD483]